MSRSQSVLAALAATVVACHSASPAPSTDAGVPYASTRPRLVWPARGALVSLPDDDRLEMVDLETRRVVDARSVGRDPVGIDAPTDLALGLRGDDPVVFTLLAPTVAGEAPGPHAARASRDRVAWIVALSQLDARPIAELRVGPHPGALAVSDDGSRLVVTHYDLAGDTDGGPPDGGDFARATVLDVPTRALAASNSPDPLEIPTCVGARGVALSPGDGHVAAVACAGEDAVALVDLALRKVTRVPVVGAGGARTRPAFVATTGERVMVACAETREVRIVDMRSLEVQTPRDARWTATPTSVRFSSDGRVAYVTLDDGRVGVLDLAGATTRTFGPFVGCEHAVDVAFDSPDVVLLCARDRGGGALVVLDAASMSPRGEAVAFAHPPARVAVVRR